MARGMIEGAEIVNGTFVVFWKMSICQNTQSGNVEGEKKWFFVVVVLTFLLPPWSL